MLIIIIDCELTHERERERERERENKIKGEKDEERHDGKKRLNPSSKKSYI